MPLSALPVLFAAGVYRGRSDVQVADSREPVSRLQGDGLVRAGHGRDFHLVHGALAHPLDADCARDRRALHGIALLPGQYPCPRRMARSDWTRGHSGRGLRQPAMLRGAAAAMASGGRGGLVRPVDDSPDFVHLHVALRGSVARGPDTSWHATILFRSRMRPVTCRLASRGARLRLPGLRRSQRSCHPVRFLPNPRPASWGFLYTRAWAGRRSPERWSAFMHSFRDIPRCAGGDF